MDKERRGERTRRQDSRGWFFLGVANMVTPYALLSAVAGLGMMLWQYEREAILYDATAAAQRSAEAIADSLGGAIATIRASQDDLRQMFQRILAERDVDRQRLERMEKRLDERASTP